MEEYKGKQIEGTHKLYHWGKQGKRGQAVAVAATAVAVAVICCGWSICMLQVLVMMLLLMLNKLLLKLKEHPGHSKMLPLNATRGVPLARHK